MLRQFEIDKMKFPPIWSPERSQELNLAIAKHLLTKREKEVFSLLANGYSQKNAAKELNLHPDTINYYIKKVVVRKGYKSTTQAVADLVKKGEI